MRRFLIVDDEELFFDDELRRDNVVDGILTDVVHINPLDYIRDGGEGDVVVKRLLEDLRTRAREFWDVVAIDFNLGDFGYSEQRQNKEICLRVAEVVRENNNSATMYFYTGTLMKFIDELRVDSAKDTQLKRIFRAGVANFVPRNMIASEIISAVHNPSCILRIDRMLMKYQFMTVTPIEAKYNGRSFGDLAMAVRRQDNDGREITKLIVEYGIAAFLDLNS